MVKLYCKHSISILNYCSFFIFRSFVGQLLESELAFGFKKNWSWQRYWQFWLTIIIEFNSTDSWTEHSFIGKYKYFTEKNSQCKDVNGEKGSFFHIHMVQMVCSILFHNWHFHTRLFLLFICYVGSKRCSQNHCNCFCII